MLQVKSFKLSDDAGINELLLKYRLAKGASFFLSDGLICVPYEDGQEENSAQKTIDMQEMINEMSKQIVVIVHSNKVVKLMIEDLKARLVTATVDFKSEPNNKRFERVKTELENQIEENESSIRMNTYEINRLEMNIKLYNEAIAELN